jgi:tRNA-2-methylthio-N6-dimethylallyladenosine synthase
LIDAIAEEAKICEHVHLPVQSGSDRVLKRMARRYTAGEYRDICGELRRKVSGVAITTDLIVGFPGETEEDFQATMDLMREVEWEGSVIFKYSPRGQTAAARLPGAAPAPVVSDRFQRLLDLQLKMAHDSRARMRGGRCGHRGSDRLSGQWKRPFERGLSGPDAVRADGGGSGRVKRIGAPISGGRLAPGLH